MHDPCAVLAVTHPELIDRTLRHVDVELSGTLTRGMTVVDQRPGVAPGGNVEHGHHIDSGRARELFMSAVAARGGG
jgi:inosine-uridine nucleoside N-ribohydrolase